MRLWNLCFTPGVHGDGIHILEGGVVRMLILILLAASDNEFSGYFA
jgi:hypothetical protein